MVIGFMKYKLEMSYHVNVGIDDVGITPATQSLSYFMEQSVHVIWGCIPIASL